MRFILASSNRYPTEKAYGVSFQNTAKTLRDLGYPVEIYSPSFHGKDWSGTEVLRLAQRSYGLLHSKKFFLRGFRRMMFYLVELVFSTATTLRVQRMKDPVIIWTRSTILCAIASKFVTDANVKIVLEIHDTKSRVNFFLRFVRNDYRVSVFTPLYSQARFLEDKFALSQVVAVGNAAPADYFGEKCSNSTNMRIGYIGKLESSGHSNNIGALLNLATLIHRNQLNIEVELVGISSIEILKLIGQSALDALPPNLTFVEHVSHDEIRNHLSRFKIGVVPYPDSAYHNERFPIKVVEYAAMGIPMIICNSNYLDSVIPGDFVYLSEPTADSIYETVLEIVNFPKLATYKSEHARKWSEDFTYISRTRKILTQIGAISDESF